MNEERCKRLEERQAALEQRVGAAIDVAIATLRDEIGVEDALDRLAALRSPGGVIPSEPVDVAEMQAQIHEADMDRIAAALSTWQAERLANEALAGGPPPPHDCGDGPVNDEPGATTWRGLVDAKEAEIADLRERCAFREQERDEARAEIAGLKAERTKLLKEQHAEEQKLRARIAELEARDREGRWLVERSNHRQVGKSASDKQRAEMDDYSRRADAYLSGTVPPDPARGLIEWLVAAYGARISELEARDREGRWLLTRSEWSPNNSGTDRTKIGWTKIEDEYDDRRADYLSGTVPPDPARGLIEWLVAAYDGCSRRGTIEECSAQERAVYDAIRDLRAHLGGGT